MKTTFFARRALPILCVVFFLVPFALRGARMSLERMENNVKDWLPDDFSETEELAWFGRHFIGEQSFILLTWEGCSENDPSFDLFVRKLRNEIAPDPSAELEQLPPEDEEQRKQFERRQEVHRARSLGDQLGLYTTGKYWPNWGGKNEKWLMGADGRWYYITPEGELFRWNGRSNLLGALSRVVKRKVLGDESIQGQYVATLGKPPTGDDSNDFYADPRRMTARILKSVTTGPDVLAELAAPGGALWPVGTEYSEQERPQVARRRALERLEGVLYGPEPYEDFDWTTAQFSSTLTELKRSELPANWEATFQQFVGQLIENRYDGRRDQLIAAPIERREQHWKDLFAALEVEPPGLQTSIMVTLSPAGARDLRHVIGRGLLGKPRGKLVDLAAESGITPPPQPPMTPFSREAALGGRVLRMGGPPVDNVAIDEEGQITLVRLVGFSIFIGIGLSYLCFRSVKVTIMVFFVGGISAVTSLSIVWWSGKSVDAILMSMPSLVYVLGLSGAVHIVNYYRDAAQEHGLDGAPERALKHGMAPCTLAAFTTALGLLSLYTSNIYPIKKFGLFSAIGVMATLILLFTYLPSALQLWPPNYHKRRSTNEGAPQPTNLLISFWGVVGNWIIRRHLWVTAVCILLVIVVGAGLPKLNTSIQLLKLFDSNAKIIRDYHWLEGNVGKLVPMELVVRVPPNKLRASWQIDDDETEPIADGSGADMPSKYQYKFLERVELVGHVQNAVEQAFGEQGADIVGKAFSVVTVTPPIMDPTADTERALINTKLEQHRERLLREDYMEMDDQDGSELYRISVRLGALNDVDYGLFVSDLKRVVEPILAAYRYRDRILQALEAQLNTSQVDSPVAWNQGSVLVLGAANPMIESGGEEPSAPTTSTTTSAAGQEIAVDQQVLFTHTLNDLMRAKGFRGKMGRQIPKRYLEWHDPVAKPLGKDARSPAWGKTLERFQIVVLAGDHADYDLAFIRQHAGKVIDVRDFRFGQQDGDQLTAKQRGEPIHVTYTGVVPIVYKAQRTLLISLTDSIFWAFVMIAIVMMFLLRTRKRQLINLRGGLVSMLPNLFPVILIFGIMGHMNVLVDIGSMMTASVAMGVAVDDTIHFLTWFRDGIRLGMKRNHAILLAYERCGAAMTQTTLIGGLGLAVFAFSTFTPTQRFGTMMLTLLAAALVGDLILLPALLAGPLGRFFEPREATGLRTGLSEAPELSTVPTPTPERPAEPESIETPHSKSRARPGETPHLRRDSGHARP